MLKSSIHKLSALLLTLLLLAGCGAGSSGGKDDPGDGGTPVVNQPPVALDQSASTQEGSPVAVTLTGTDPEGSPLTFSLHGLPSHGTVTGAPPSVTYSPDAGYVGADSFTFSVSDGEKLSNVATVTLAISAPPPLAPPALSPIPSYYSTPQTIVLSASAGASIRYTLDGSNPTPDHGMLYTGSFTAGSDVKLKAVAFKGGFVSQLSQGVYQIRVPATGEVRVTILSPNPIEGGSSGVDTRRIESVGNSALVAAQVTAGVELDSVTASVGDRTVPLVFKNDVFCWTTRDLQEQCYDGFGGTLDLSGLPVGVMELTVTARDHLGNEGSKTILITHDAPPTLTVLAPASGASAHPDMRFAATCTDDEGGCEIHVSVSNPFPVPNIVPPGFDSVDAVADLSEYSGQMLSVRFSAADKGEHVVFNASIGVRVEVAQNLDSVATVAGEAVDFDGGRVLSLIKAEAGQTLRITRVSDNSTEDHALPTGFEVAKDMGGTRAFLTPVGAVAMAQSYSPTYTLTLTSWENGQAVDLGSGVIPSSLKVKGDWGIWYGGALYRRNFTTGVTEFVAGDAGNWNNDITGTGAVAYWKGGGGIVLKTDEGVREMTDPAWRNVYPLTDGVNAVYLKVANGNTASPLALAYTDFTTETLLTDFTANEPAYRLGGGRVYFTSPGTLGQTAIWRREPDGTVAKLTFFTSDSSLDSAGADGTAMIVNGYDRYLIGLDANLTKVSGGLGKTLRIGGEWYLLLGDWVGRYR